MIERKATGQTEVLPLSKNLERLYAQMAKDPVTFFLESERLQKIPLDLDKVMKVLSEFRERTSFPENDPRRLIIKKNEVAPDLREYAAFGNGTHEHYEALFRMMRALGFSTTDCIAVLMEDIDIEKSIQAIDGFMPLVTAAAEKVEKMTTLPPISRKRESSKTPHN